MGSDMFLDPPPYDYGHNAELYLVNYQSRAWLVAVKRSHTTSPIRRWCEENVDVNASFEFIDSFNTDRQLPFVLIDNGDFISHWEDHATPKTLYPKFKETLERAGVPLLLYEKGEVTTANVYWEVIEHHVHIYAEHSQRFAEILANSMPRAHVVRETHMKRNHEIISIYIREDTPDANS